MVLWCRTRRGSSSTVGAGVGLDFDFYEALGDLEVFTEKWAYEGIVCSGKEHNSCLETCLHLALCGGKCSFLLFILFIHYFILYLCVLFIYLCVCICMCTCVYIYVSM